MKEILVLCPFGVDKGLLSKAARLSGGELRALVPAGCGSEIACGNRKTLMRRIFTGLPGQL